MKRNIAVFRTLLMIALAVTLVPARQRGDQASFIELPLVGSQEGI